MVRTLMVIYININHDFHDIIKSTNLIEEIIVIKVSLLLETKERNACLFIYSFELGELTIKSY